MIRRKKDLEQQSVDDMQIPKKRVKRKKSVPSQDTKTKVKESSKKVKTQEQPQQQKQPTAKVINQNPVHEQYKKIATNTFISLLIICGVIGSGTAVVKQVNDYRKSLNYTKSLDNEAAKLETEWHKLLLEQQAFGSTGEIGDRAFNMMNMRSPKPTDVYITNLSTSENKDSLESPTNE